MATLGSAFELLTSDPAELALLKAKSKLVMVISEKLQTIKGSRTKFAKENGISDRSLSYIMNGQLSRVSMDQLIRINAKIGNAQSEEVNRKSISVLECSLTFTSN